MTKALPSARSFPQSTASLAVTLAVAIALHLSASPILAEQTLVISGGHSLEVTAIALNHSSQLFATGSEDRTAILWQSDSGKQLCQFIGHEDAVCSVAFSRDSRILVTGSDDSTAMIWSCETGKRIHTLKQHSKKVLSVDISPTGSQVVTGSVDSTAIIWNALTGQIEQTLVHGTDVVEAVAFSPNCDLIATATDHGSITVWKSSSGELIDRFKFEATTKESNNGKKRLRFSDDGARLLVLNRFNELSVWRIADKKREIQIDSMKFDAVIVGGQLIGCGKVSADIRNLSTGSQISAASWKTKTPGTSGDDSPTFPASISSDGKLFFTVTGSHCKVWNVASGKTERTIPLMDLAPIHILTSNTAGDQLLATNSNGSVTVWDTKTAKLLSKFQAADGPIERLSFSPDGRLILVDPDTFTPGGITIWDSRTLQRRFDFDAGKMPGLNVRIDDGEFSADGSHIVGRFVNIGYVFKSDTGAKVQELYPKYSHLVASSNRGSSIVIADTKLTELDPNSGQRKILLENIGQRSSAKQICFSPIGDLVCVMGSDQTFVSSLAKKATAFEIPEIAGEWDEALFSPDGSRLVTSVTSFTFSAKGGHPLCELRETKSGRSVKTFDYLTASAFAPDSKMLVLIPAFYVSWSNMAYIADTETGEILFTLPGHTCRIRDAQYSNDGRKIWTASEDGTVGVWNATTGDLIARLASFGGSNDWVCMTADGYFDGSPNAGQYLHSISNSSPAVGMYASEEFRRPDTIAERLKATSLAPTPPPNSPRTKPPVSQPIVEPITPPNVPPPTTPPLTTTPPIVPPLTPPRAAPPTTTPPRTTPPPTSLPPTTPPPNAIPNVADTNRDSFGIRLVVLTIGISKHEDEKLTLPYPHSDATEITEALKKQSGRAFTSVVTKSIINSEATISGIRNGLKWLQEQCRENDYAFVMFSGHGGQSGNGLYYMPYRREIQIGGMDGFAWRELAAELGISKLKAQQVMLFTDCCYSGAFASHTSLPFDSSDFLKRQGVMVFASSKPTEVSLQMSKLKHGAFSFSVLEALAGKADFDGDKKITLSEIVAFVTGRVKVLTDDRQHPFLPPGSFDPGLILVHL